MKKSYVSPEFDFIQLKISTWICTPSAEISVPGEEIIDNGDDIT